MGLIQNKVTVSQPNSHVVVKNAGGLRGLTGETGPQGPQGVPGQAATVTAGTTTTLPAGSAATVQNVGSTSAAIFNFGIPKGDKGDTGESGAAATISVGTTSTLPAGSSATVTNSGTSSAAVFDFGIPKGDKGDTGATGADGYSPSATVTKTGDTATITITDKDGTTTASISDGRTPTVNDGTLTIQKNGTTVQTFSADQASNVTANITVPTQFSELSGTVSSSQIEDEAITTGSVSGTGTNITLAGTMEGGAIESVELNGDTEQTTYSGKNLYEGSPSFSSYVNISGWEDGGTYNGMPVIKRAGAWGGAYKIINVEAGNTYTFSLWVKADQAKQGAIYSSGSSTGATATISPNSETLNIPTNWERVSLTFECSVSGTVALRVENWTSSDTNYTYIAGYQLEKNSSATSFEPYVGGTASPNPDYPQAVQTVTGEQSIEVRGSKNLFDKNAITSGYLVGRADGILAANVSYGASDFIRVQEGETYTFSSGFNYWYSAYYDSNKQYVGYPTNTATVTVPAGVSYIRTSLLLTNLDTAQFEKGSTATTYEPYKGVTKTVNLGKNLLPFTNQNFTKNNITFSVTDGTLYLDGTSTGETGSADAIWKTNFSFTLPAGTYTFSLNTFTMASYIKKKSDDSNLAVVNGTTLKTATFTITEPTEVYLGFYMYNLSFSNLATTYQLEKGSTATTYAPYFTPIELCKIGTYENVIFKNVPSSSYYSSSLVEGAWYVHKDISKIVIDGSQNVTSYGTAVAGKYRYSVPATGAANVAADVVVNMSDKFVGVTRGDTYNNVNGMYQASGLVGFYWDAIATYTTAQVQTWLSANNVIAYYPLATPTDTQITNEALIAQLEDLLSATTYSGTTYITVSGDLASPLEVVAEADSKLAPDSVYGAAIKDGAVSVDKIADLKALADALAPYLNS